MNCCHSHEVHQGLECCFSQNCSQSSIETVLVELCYHTAVVTALAVGKTVKFKIETKEGKLYAYVTTSNKKEDMRISRQFYFIF